MKNKQFEKAQENSKKKVKKDNYILVGIGEILWDILPEGPRLGGAPANFAYYAQALGEKGIIVSKVGSDLNGEKIIAHLHYYGLESLYIARDDKHPTGIVTVKLDNHGNPQFKIHEDCAWDYLEITPQLRKLAEQADAVCFGSLAQRSPFSRQAIREFITQTRADCLRIFDVNLRAPYYASEDIDFLLNRSQIFKLNEDELWTLSGLFQIESKLENHVINFFFSRYPIKLIVLTRGERGSTLYTREKISNSSAFPVKVSDTVGAGDAFTAAVVVGLLYQRDLDQINETANQIASYVCSQPGAWSPLSDELRNKI